MASGFPLTASGNNALAISGRDVPPTGGIGDVTIETASNDYFNVMNIPLLDGRTSAIIEKELRYYLRDSRTLMNIASPSIFALMIVLSRGAAQKIFATGLKLQSTGSNVQVIFPAAAVLLT